MMIQRDEKQIKTEDKYHVKQHLFRQLKPLINEPLMHIKGANN